MAGMRPLGNRTETFRLRSRRTVPCRLVFMNCASNRHCMMRNEQREQLRGWFTGRLPDGLFEELAEVTVDREEITVIGRVPGPRPAKDVSPAEREAVVEGRVQEFRERTRDDRI